MALIEEYKNGPTTVKIYDDYIKSREESIEILQRLTDKVLLHLNAKHNAKQIEDKTA